MLNAYSYVANNPTNYFDPDGRAPKDLHSELLVNWGFPTSFAEGSAARDFLWFMGAVINPTEHFGGMDEARRLAGAAVEAYKVGDFRLAEKLMETSVHTAIDAAYHKTPDGEKVGFWKHFWLAITGRNPDKNDPGGAKKDEARENTDVAVGIFERGTQDTIPGLIDKAKQAPTDADLFNARATGGFGMTGFGSANYGEGYFLGVEMNYRHEAYNQSAMDPHHSGPRPFTIRR